MSVPFEAGRDVARKGSSLNIAGIDHVEFYVADAVQSAAELCAGFGFRITGRSSGETGLPGYQAGLPGGQSVLTGQHDIKVLFTSATDPAHPAAEFVRRHGDGPAVIGFSVADARACYAEAVQGGATPVAPPAGDAVTFATVRGVGDVAHRFVTRRNRPSGLAGTGARLRRIDHLTVCLEASALGPAVRAYQDSLGFTQTFADRCTLGEQRLNSVLMQSPGGAVAVSLLAPDPGAGPGPVTGYLGRHGGAGIQCIAFDTPDITATVRYCAAHGVRFHVPPASYYTALPGRLGPAWPGRLRPALPPVSELRALGILADQDYWGLMLQVFAESPPSHRMVRYQLIERRGALTVNCASVTG